MTWGNFTREEFKCRCCGRNEIKDEFIDVMQEIRNEYGAPISISSGYRCEKHPIEAAKPSPGEHSEGTCCDVPVHGSAAFALLKAAAANPKVTRIGVNQKGSQRFLHIGTGNLDGRGPIWSY